MRRRAAHGRRPGRGIVRAALVERIDVAFEIAAYLPVMDTSTRGAPRAPGSPPAGRWMKLGDDLKRFERVPVLPDAERHDVFARAAPPRSTAKPPTSTARCRSRTAWSSSSTSTRQGRPARRAALLEAADPGLEIVEAVVGRSGRRRGGAEEGAARRRPGRGVRGRPAGASRTPCRGAGARRTVGHARLPGLRRPRPQKGDLAPGADAAPDHQGADGPYRGIPTVFPPC